MCGVVPGMDASGRNSLSMIDGTVFPVGKLLHLMEEKGH
jgi:hypothetical protein